MTELTKLEDLKMFINASDKKNEDGKTYEHQSLENYIENVLELDIVVSENLGDKNSYQDVFEFIAKSRKFPDVFYEFSAEFIDFEDYKSRENIIILKSIKKHAEVMEVEHRFYLNKMREKDNKENSFLNNSFEDLKDGADKDNELDTAVNLFIENLKDQPGYVYNEETKGDKYSFRIRINEEVVIGASFQNAIQISFKKDFTSLIVVFRKTDYDKLKKEIENICSVINDYLNWELQLNEISISNIYDTLKNYGISAEFNTSILLGEKDVKLFMDFVIGKYDTYKQVQVSIVYNENEKFEVNINYLLKDLSIVCNTAEELMDLIDELKEMTKEEA